MAFVRIEAVMTDVSSCNPHKEEDEGYLAAEAGIRLAANPYPRGTIRHDEWRRGWHIKRDANLLVNHEGYLAAEAGKSLAENPHPRGTLRFDQWRRSWRLKQDEISRAIRLGRDVEPRDRGT